MGKYFGISRYEIQPLLMQKYNLSDKDWDRLTELWHTYGMRHTGDMSNCTPSNHYYLQGILEHLAIEWDSWNEGMSNPLKDIIQAEFPQLMVQDREFEID
ncbi:hypothetical protein [Bacteroides thetaiotaomicron]|jgi:hypothetical protein|uniref:Uncharacterized protein n=1 Tax=Bacteroides thetaiotaomicron TaxID=818 RepID=A0A679HJK3_BACT4|nr:hypothetical protein [Bacteroides thetaiotaomicron]BCA49865.1 hypothetical protein BatF92_18070 [Bacteroides thetaiotaomicron]